MTNPLRRTALLAVAAAVALAACSDSGSDTVSQTASPGTSVGSVPGTIPEAPATSTTTVAPAPFASCEEMRASGVESVASVEPRFNPALDTNGDGTACNEPVPGTEPAPDAPAPGGPAVNPVPPTSRAVTPPAPRPAPPTTARQPAPQPPAPQPPAPAPPTPGHGPDGPAFVAPTLSGGAACVAGGVRWWVDASGGSNWAYGSNQQGRNGRIYETVQPTPGPNTTVTKTTYSIIDLKNRRPVAVTLTPPVSITC